jgi:hypothetical protein
VFVTQPADEYSYAYLLGMYLGDGHLTSNGRSWQLIVSIDAAHEDIVEECRAAMVLWRELIPQHGPGRKHERPIVLTLWQRAIVERHPWPFVRGLIHSDGCRTMNRFQTRLPSGRVAEYAYPRYYLFSNLSAEIRGMFCESCEQLGLRWTQSNHRNISISHRASVALLDEHVGPKG